MIKTANFVCLFALSASCLASEILVSRDNDRVYTVRMDGLPWGRKEINSTNYFVVPFEGSPEFEARVLREKSIPPFALDSNEVTEVEEAIPTQEGGPDEKKHRVKKTVVKVNARALYQMSKTPGFKLRPNTPNIWRPEVTVRTNKVDRNNGPFDRGRVF